MVLPTQWLRRAGFETYYLNFINRSITSATLIFSDNISSVYLSSNPVKHQKKKYIEIDIHFIREKVALGEVKVLHVPSEFQYAYIFTKGLVKTFDA
ncbi:hypothetical protein Bca101_059773 [Brassica carinata]